MQFTELSELNKVVGMMRIAACNSPTFHDRQDSEVDRIFNSSPKMELQLRNSWIDKMAAFKPSASAAAGAMSPGTKPVPTTASSAAAAAAAAAAANDAAKAADAKANESKIDSGADAKARRGVSGAGKDAAGKNGEAVANGKEEKSAGAESKQKDDGLSFEREAVVPVSFPEVSLLDKILKGSSVALGPKPVMMSGAEGSAVLHLTIYLPTRTEMMIDLYDVSTVDESIQEILRNHQANNRQPPLYYGHPECYELRLHDADGYPDEDFPGTIKNFGDAGGHEYCLCERPDACPPSGDATDASAATASKTEVPVAPKASAAGDKSFLKIYMPKSDDYTVVAIDGTTIGQDLLPTLNKKHRLQLFQDQYVLKISEAERERLDLPSDEIDMHTKLRPLNLHEVTLATKQYADAPQIPVTVTTVAEDTATNDGRSRPPPETFMFNDVTAAMFKEWRVIKKNKYGKKQQRMFGIDQHKVYNRKVGERVIKSRNTTKIAERPITSVGWVRFMTDPSDFQIYYKDSLEEIVTDYTAESPYECAEIVAKLKYILSRRK
ncbi:hypothetical protein PybrP1_005360 [[Pythium] brassicae (nom. inval.)]|nr:hypothetical protein PybrP1_005360 [[Pythium] brassicae (nom. inval.)]